MSTNINETPETPDINVEDPQLVAGNVQPQSDFFEKNQNLILGGVAIFLLIAASIFIYRKFIKEPAQAEASEMMWHAQQRFDQDSFALALENPAPGQMGFLDIADNYGSTPAGNLANYYAGVCYLNLGQFDAAISYLEDFSATGNLLPATKEGALGDAYAEKGDLATATSHYEKAVSLAGTNIAVAPYFIKKLGLLKEHNGDLAGAKALYQRIQAEFTQSNEATDIVKYIARVSK